MEHLFAVRHGAYDRATGKLNGDGCKVIQMVGRKIKEIVGNDSDYAVISSPAVRASQSAEGLVAELGSPKSFEEIPYLWAGPDAPSGGYQSHGEARLAQIIDAKEETVDVLVMVTHLEVLRDLLFSEFYARRDPSIRPERVWVLHFGIDRCKCEKFP